MSRFATALALIVLLSSPAFAQPSLDSLWPNEDGKSWSYAGTYDDYLLSAPQSFTARLIFEGTGIGVPGVELQNLIGQIDGIPVNKVAGMPAGLPPLMQRLWVARPDLREGIAQYAGKQSINFWPSLLLSPAEIAYEVGHRQTVDTIGTWRVFVGIWSWWYLTEDLLGGTGFTLQLVPDLADDVYLHGTLRGTSESIDTPAGSWNNATVVDYRIDYGVLNLTNEQGEVIGTIESETSGWVAFVPEVGPVACYEEYFNTSVDCPTGCPEVPPVGVLAQVVELSLVSLPVAVRESSWGSLKANY